MDVFTALNKLYDRFGRQLQAGEVICTEGEDSSEMYFILEGGVDVYKKVATTDKDGENVKLTSLGATDFFGEMSLLNGEKRSATIIANTNGTKIVRISPGNFDTIIKLQPQIAITMLKVLCKRLRSTSEKIKK